MEALLPNKPLGVTVAKWYTIYMSRADRYMSRADRLKEEIGWLKVAFGIAVALAASLVAWLAQNYATASPIIGGGPLTFPAKNFVAGTESKA